MTPSPLSQAIAGIRPALGATAVLGIFVNLAMLVTPLYSMQVYDRVLSSHNVTTLLLLTAIALGFLVVYGFLEYARGGILQRAAMRLDDILAAPLLGLALKTETPQSQGAGALAIKDAETLRDFVGGGIISALMDVPWIPVFMLLCFILHPVLGCVSLAGAAIVAAVAWATEATTKSGLAVAGNAANESSRLLAGVLRNSEAVRGLGMQDAVLNRWRKAQEKRFVAQVAVNDRNGAMLSIAKVVRMAIQICLMCTGAWLALTGAVSPGAMLASSILMGRALAPLEQVVGQWKRISQAQSAYHRLIAYFASRAQDAKPIILPAPKGHLTVENVFVQPATAAVPTLRGVNFSLSAGESLAVIGASGSGKSSLARILTGVWSPARGAVRVDGATLDQWDPVQIGRATGYLPQDVELFAGTVAENIARLGTVDEEAVTTAAQAAGAHDEILRLPQGYATEIGTGGGVLSGGMRQRIGLARALYGRPRLIVLDEPNSNLDAAGEQALADTLARLKADRATVVVITHRPQVLRHVDKVLVLGDGETRAFGPRDQVLALLNGTREPQPADASQPKPAAQAA